MKKKEFEDFCLLHAKWAREEMIADKGSFRQRSVVVDLRGRLHVAIYAEVLHGYRMRDTLKVMALAAGGADAFLIMADTRFKMISDPNEVERISQSAARGVYTVADDESNREAIVVAGRSHEHILLIRMPYRRKVEANGRDCIITFDDPEPKIMDSDWNVESDMLPNPWERVH